MKKLRFGIFLLVFSLLASSPVFAQTNKKAELKRIDAYSKTIDAFVKKHKSPQLIFADVSDYDADKPEWRRYDSEREFEKARETVESYNTAYVWRKNGRIVMANFTLSSPSGDWAQYVYHYFRADGSAAKVESELRTFHGNLIVVQDFYLDPKGRVLKKTLKYLDLETQKPKKPSKDDLLDNGDNLYRVEYYKKTSKLPFTALLKGKK
ncbi:MAG TPA: hypothetical protein VK892_03455, partial [Pyrinomonadaceae bacterium]|nr:hypothetical protein [Pyrinomonadaceae bacterium]